MVFRRLSRAFQRRLIDELIRFSWLLLLASFGTHEARLVAGGERIASPLNRFEFVIHRLPEWRVGMVDQAEIALGIGK